MLVFVILWVKEREYWVFLVLWRLKIEINGFLNDISSVK